MNRIFIDTNTKRDEVQSMFTIIFISANVNCSNLVMSGINKDSVKKKNFRTKQRLRICSQTFGTR